MGNYARALFQASQAANEKTKSKLVSQQDFERMNVLTALGLSRELLTVDWQILGHYCRHLLSSA